MANGRSGDIGDIDSSGGGGGGGGGGYSNLNNGSIINGGDGGDGGLGGHGGLLGGGGGGGAGGDGAVSTATGPVTVSAPVVGGLGSPGNFGGGGGSNGGGGGGGGAGLVADSREVTINADVTGGNGGGGFSFGSGGGGGGAGIVLQQGGTLDITAPVGGSNVTVAGGAGGAGYMDGDGGSGVKANAAVAVTVADSGKIQGGSASGAGSGGVGIDAAFGGTIVNAGTIAGGNSAGLVGNRGATAGGAGSGGAAGGSAGGFGRAGVGGAGIIGAGLSITNSGTISGGKTPSRQANAITFTGGDNFLANTGTLTGGIEVQNNATFAPAMATSPIGTALNLGAAPLTFASGTSYNIRIAPNANDSVTTTGEANLGNATVNATFAPGAYVTKQYTILTAHGGRNGEFGSLVSTTTPANFTSSLSYDATHAYLNLVLHYASPGGLNSNQQNVANGLESFFNDTGGIPLAFAGLDPRGLSQASGEIATNAVRAAFDAQSQFLNVLTDPFTGGQSGGQQGAAEPASSSQALGYAETRKSQPHDAFASLDAKALPAQRFEPGWRLFGAAYGGNAEIGGNASTGSHDATSRVYGMMAGAAYALSPNTRVGFALGGGGTSFGLSGGLGSGRSDMFQAGVFARHGNARGGYVSGAFAYGWHDVRTDRTAPTGEQLRGSYDANVFSGRIETGWRFETQFGGVTPYAAGQAISYDMASYLERGNGGPNSFALDYAGHTATATRSELGLRFDRAMRFDNALVTLRGRAAWAHNFDTGNNAAATFLSLPGAGFIVNGAAVSPDAALISAGAEVSWRNGFSLAATFEGEFSDNVTSYAGKASVRYRW